MQYVKFQLVDFETGVSAALATPGINGKVIPTQLTGLSVAWVRGDYYFGTVNDSVTANPTNYIFILTPADFATAVQDELAQRKTETIQTICQLAINLRAGIVDGWYHWSELAGGSTKYNQALLAQAATTETEAQTNAPLVALEATTRGITTKALADIIVADYNAMAELDAKLCGTRGAKCDAINAITFDPANPLACLATWSSTEADPSGAKDPMGNPRQVGVYDVNRGWPAVNLSAPS